MPIKSLVAIAALSLSLAPLSYAAVVQSSGPEGGISKTAVLYQSTGMEWLSPTHTVGLTYTEVLETSWVEEYGFRVASQAELMTMLNDAGVEIGSPPVGGAPHVVGNLSAMQRLITMLGATYVNNAPSQPGDFGQLSVYGMTSDLFPDGWGQLFDKPSRTYAYFYASASGAAFVPDGQWLWGSRDSLVGAFLVRTVPAVPEPASVLLLGAGVAVVALRRRRS